MKVTQYRVHPNPYVLIHRLQGAEDGVQWAGTFPLYSEGPAGTHGQLPRYVGCRVDEEATKKLSEEKTLTVKGKTATLSYASHDLAYVYSKEPVVININSEEERAYYRNAIFCNDLTGHSALIAADLETARACGLNSDQFKDPLQLLEELRLEAIDRFAASNSFITKEELLERLPSVFGTPGKPPPTKAGGTGTANTSTPAKATDGGEV